MDERRDALEHGLISLRLLLVEDSEDDALLLVHELERNDFEVSWARVQTASELEDAMTLQNWNVAMVDYLLPQFSGLEAIRLIRERFTDLPLIVVSGKIGEEIAVAAMRAGAHDYVMKNNLARLAAAVRRELADANTRQQKRIAESALQESEARYRAIVEDQTEHVFRWLPDGTLTFVNRAFCDYHEKPRTQIIGSNCLDDIISEDRRELRQKISILTPQSPVVITEQRVIRPDKPTAWHEWTSRGVFDSERQLMEVQTVGRDITEVRQAIETERQRLLLVEVLRDTAAALNSTLDVNGVFDRILANVGWVIPHDAAAIFTVSANNARLLRMSGWESMGIDDIPEQFALTSRELTALAAMAASGQPIVIQDTAKDNRWRVKSHRLNWVRSFAAAPLFDDQRAIGVMALFCKQPDFFSPSHLELLQGFASQAASAARNARLYETVSRSQDELRQLSDQMVRAIEDERRRLSRELHDEVGQVLTALILNADFVLGALGEECDETARQRLLEISNMARRSLEQIRDLSLRLRPAMLDELGLEPTLRWYSSAFAKRTGLDVNLTVNGMEENRSSFALETTLYRAVQEALTNVTRHAEAKTVSIELEKLPHVFELRVRDDGIGFDPDSLSSTETAKGLGLLGMRERVLALGGELRIQSFPESGTTIEIRLPDLTSSDTAPGVLAE